MNQSNYYTTLPGGNFILLPSATLEVMQNYRQIKRFATEAGGLIIGSMRQETMTISFEEPPHMEVVDVSEPGPGDKRSRYGFDRRAAHHIELVKTARQKQSMVDYIGEWHTHPESHPTPSSTDYYYWRRNLRNRLAMLIIIGTKTEWVGYWNGQRAIALPTLIEEQQNTIT